ncbi:MAG TPA: glycosyltransferase, partial [Puia sp.]|nr:glycosyltransferase [Puia sp.]
MTGSAPNPSSTGLVYCIIVTYNGIAWVEKCLNSLIRSSYPLTVLVVDNCSTDSTVPTIRE